MDPTDFFSARVDEADRKFSIACLAAGATLRTYSHPALGPDGESLRTSVARIGASDAPDVLVVISGTHGIEGYCGAGIQTGILRSLDTLTLPTTLAVVLVHQINPWGCAWDRRENEDNVDLFRNFLYCDPPYAANPEYDAIADALCPPEWDGPSRAAAESTLSGYESKHGAGSIIRVARRGQHDYPRGLTYQGRGPTWSKRTMDAIVASELAAARRVFNLDIHTGYGNFGEGAVVCAESRGSDTARRLIECFGDDLLWLGTDPVIPTHPGMPYDRLCASLSADVMSFALEFGTANVADEFDLLREASWVFNYGDPQSEHGRSVRTRYRALFYPEMNEWKRLVWERGRDVFATAVTALIGRSA
jgi:hypothetical protein